MHRHPSPRPALPWAVAALVGLLHPPAVAGQPPRLFPDRALLPELLSGPRDPVVGARIAYLTDDPALYGPGLGGEVSLAAVLPVLRLAGSTPGDALVVGLNAAVFSRFSFEVVPRELVNTDWVFAVPVVRHLGPHWVRARYHHTSSHLGDEYQARFQQERAVDFSRDALDVTAYLRAAPGLGLYGSARWSYNTHPEERPHWGLRAGAEVGVPRSSGRAYVALDVQLDESEGWTPSLVTQAGLGLPPASGRPLRVVLELLAGPTPMGQFHGRHVTQFSLGMLWNP